MSDETPQAAPQDPPATTPAPAVAMPAAWAQAGAKPAPAVAPAAAPATSSAPESATPAAAASAPAAPSDPTAPSDPAGPTPPTPDAEVSMPAAWGGSAGKKSNLNAWGVVEDESVRIVHKPLEPGIGDGKAFFFLFGFKLASEIDQNMLKRELEQIDDDIEVLRKAGYTVVVDPQAGRADFTSTLYGEGAGEGVAGLIPVGFYWSAHGHTDGGIECCDGSLIHPTDVDPTKVSPGLRLAIFGACYVGARSMTWKTALGGHPLVVGWGRPVTIDRAVDFLTPDDATNTDLDDLIRRWLLTDDPLPTEAAAQSGVPESPVKRGRIGELAARIASITEMLGGRWREVENHLQIEVPLANRRTQLVDVFVIDANEPYCEGELLFGAESNVGELTTLTDASALLSHIGHAGYGRVALVKSETDMPRIVTQGFAPMSRVTDQHLAAQIFQVASKADALEQQVFGGDYG